METPRPLDLEILRFLSRFGYARAWHVLAWTGAGAWTIEERLRELRKAGLVRVMDAGADLWDPELHRIRPVVIPVWTPTARGARIAGPSVVPGTDRTVNPRPSPPSPAAGVRILPAVDLATWYRAFGYQVASPREVRSIEQESPLRPDRPTVAIWGLQSASVDEWLENGLRHPLRLPALGVIHPDGEPWAVHIEASPRPFHAYRALVRDARARRMGRVWHAASKTASRRLLAAGWREGADWKPHPSIRGVMVSADGLLRVQGYRPAPVGLNTPTTWRGLVPRTPPAGIDVPRPLPDLRASWKPSVRRDELRRSIGLPPLAA